MVSIDQKHKLVKELLEITKQSTQLGLHDNEDGVFGMSSELASKQQQLSVELYLEFFSEAQLEAQLEFYRSAIGQSIVESQLRFNLELRKRLPGLVEEMNRTDPNTGPDPKLIAELLKQRKIPSRKKIVLTENKPLDETDT